MVKKYIIEEQYLLKLQSILMEIPYKHGKETEFFFTNEVLKEYIEEEISKNEENKDNGVKEST